MVKAPFFEQAFDTHVFLTAEEHVCRNTPPLPRSLQLDSDLGPLPTLRDTVFIRTKAASFPRQHPSPSPLLMTTLPSSEKA